MSPTRFVADISAANMDVVNTWLEYNLKYSLIDLKSLVNIKNLQKNKKLKKINTCHMSCESDCNQSKTYCYNIILRRSTIAITLSNVNEIIVFLILV